MEEVFSFSRVAILLMAGSGERFHSVTPKQFLKMGGHPLFAYAARVLAESPEVDFILYVVPKGTERATEEALVKEGLKKPHAVIDGGASRSESAQEAVRYLAAQGLKPSATILLQDADRPFLSERYLQENFEAAANNGASVTAVPSSDSVAISKEPLLIDGYLPREEVYLLQTPQAFRFALLQEAFAKSKAHGYTDEGSLVLGVTGIAPHIVIGDKNNIKITEPADMFFFETRSAK